MKKYQCHKIVEAEPAFRYNSKIYLKTSLYPRHENQEDGYKVIYEDGYISWSPKDVFEAGYTEIK